MIDKNSLERFIVDIVVMDRPNLPSFFVIVKIRLKKAYKKGKVYFLRSITNSVVDLISSFFLTEGKEKNWNQIDSFTEFVIEPFLKKIITPIKKGATNQVRHFQKANF